jgi:hypothetical protein
MDYLLARRRRRMGRRVRVAVLGAILLIINVSSAVPIAVSTFDSGDEGWLVVSTLGHSGSPDWSATGGNPGGYIYDTDMDGGWWGFLAPEKFLGDASDAFGSTLTFDFYGDTIQHETAAVVLADTTGIGIITYVDLPDSPGQIAHREVTLNNSQTWYVYDFINDVQYGVANNGDILDALLDLGYLLLGAEFADGYGAEGELVAYDNVILNPEPATIALFALGALFLTNIEK